MILQSYITELASQMLFLNILSNLLATCVVHQNEFYSPESPKTSCFLMITNRPGFQDRVPWWKATVAICAKWEMQTQDEKPWWKINCHERIHHLIHITSYSRYFHTRKNTHTGTTSFVNSQLFIWLSDKAFNSSTCNIYKEEFSEFGWALYASRYFLM